MESITRLLTEEPAVIVGFIVAVASAFWSISVEQQALLSSAIESILLLLSSFLVRMQVTPVTKLRRLGR